MSNAHKPIPIAKPYIGDEEKQAVLDVMESGNLVQGPRVAALEAAWAETVGAQFAIATSSGTTALHVALLAHGIGPGDEVITSPFTFIASVNSIIYTGATPVFVDVREDTFNLDVDLLEASITPRTKAIMPVHLYGQACEMDRILDIAAKYGLVVIEDCAQSIGATWDGRQTGSFGTGCFSLYATKNVMSGEGGMITTNDPAIAEQCRLLRAHGMKVRYYHDILGYNFRMLDLSAAIGLVQLGRLPQFNATRRRNAAFLNEHLKGVVTPLTNPRSEHVWHQYTVRFTDSDRDEAIAKLSEAGVGYGVFYPVPASSQKHVVDLGFGGAHVPVTDRIAKQVISLPVHPQLTQDDLERIVSVVNAI